MTLFYTFDMSKNSSIGSFTFWCPISKASERIVDPTTGEETMVLGGIASTADEDSDGEFLDPKGFDIKPLLESGLVNWHHQAKGQPATIIGEPRTAEIRKDGLYIETVLYPSSKIAQDVWELAQTLEKDSKTRRLGYSIEGKVLKRKSDDPKDPGYKHISKAVITGVAITHMPKNPKTFANIIKGEIDDDELEEAEETATGAEETAVTEEGMNTKRGKALMRESVDKRMKRTTFGKAEVFERLFKDIPGIAIQKASQIYSLINSIAHMKNKKTITEEDIQKAYEALGLEMEPAAEEVSKGEACGGSEEVLSKGKKKAEDAETEEVEETEEEVEETEKGCGDGDGGSKKTLKKAKKAEDAEEETEETEEEEEETEETEEVKKGGVNRFDRIEKAIATSHQLNSKSIRAVGVLVKGLMNELQSAKSENAELQELIKAQSEDIDELREAISEFGAQVPGRKSVSAARVVERQFAKSNENDFEKGEQEEETKGISMSRQANVVAEILDQATFAKGYDDEMSKACMSFEANHVLPANIIKRLKTEFGVEIVK